MKVILVKDAPGLGEEGDVRDVAKGYARNYLFPKGFAVEDNAFNRNRMKEQHKKIEQRKINKREEAQKFVDNLEALTVTISAAAAENQKLFGAVHENDIKKALEKLGYEIEKKSIQLPGPIKNTGTYQVQIRVYEGIQAQITVRVIREGEEAPSGQPAVKETDAEQAGEQAAASAETAGEDAAQVAGEVTETPSEDQPADLETTGE